MTQASNWETAAIRHWSSLKQTDAADCRLGRFSAQRNASNLPKNVGRCQRGPPPSAMLMVSRPTCPQVLGHSKHKHPELRHPRERRSDRCGHRQTLGRRPVMPVVIRLKILKHVTPHERTPKSHCDLFHRDRTRNLGRIDRLRDFGDIARDVWVSILFVSIAIP